MPPAYTINNMGQISDRTGTIINFSRIDDTEIEVPHLTPFIFTETLPNGQTVKILVSFASHCWTESYDAVKHAGQTIIMDHKWERAFDAQRFALSAGLPAMVQGLQGHNCYLTPEKRNYMAIDGRVSLPNGQNYRVVFKMKFNRGKYDGVRFRLEMFVESAYPTSDPPAGRSVGFSTIVAKALKGEIVKYHP